MSAPAIKPGAQFTTQTPSGDVIERGCVATSWPDEFGSFEGVDSEGVEVVFCIAMVKEVTT